jgi:non-specific serine/threonine protein kinase
LISWKRGDIHNSVRSLNCALEIDANHRDALLWLSLIYLIGGREASASPLIARLLDVDPLTPVNHCLPGYIDVLHGDPEAALPAYRRMHRMDAGNPATRWFLSLVLGRCGRRAEARTLLEQIIRDSPETTFARHAICLKHALERNRSAALLAVTPQLLSESRWDAHASWWMAATYALIEERDAALEWLANASSLGYINYPFLSRLDPFLESLRGDERFWSLMAEVKEQWERFAL